MVHSAALKNPYLFDKQIIDNGANHYRDILTEREAQVWYANWNLRWDSGRIGKALGIASSTVRVTLSRIRGILADGGSSIAYRSMEGQQS